MKAKPTNRPVLALLDRLAATERGFVGQEFLAPVLRGGGVQVRIAGVRCRLGVEPQDFEGWGVFRAATHVRAALVRPATMAERRRYLALFPAAGLVLVRPEGAAWLAVPAQQSDARFRIDGLVPVRLAVDAERFETVRARFDGSEFWYEESGARADPGAAAYLRQALASMTDPAVVTRSGLTTEQRNAYATEIALRRMAEEEERRRAAERIEREEQTRALSGEERVRRALTHAGAQLRDLADRGGVYRVTYEVDGRRHTSVVDKTNLAVQTAGICLSGEDRKFDLHSLVSVMREYEGTG